MRLSPEQCAVYAQVVPVFVLALIAESALFSRGPRAVRWNPMILFATAVIAGCVATSMAIASVDSGAGPILGAFIRCSAIACIGFTGGLAAVSMYYSSKPWGGNETIRGDKPDRE